VARSLVAALGWARGRVAPARPARRVLSTSLGRVSYVEDDASPGNPVVLFHDVLAGPAAMAPLFEALRGGRPVVAIDLPNHGQSERRAHAPTRDELAALAVEVLADVATRYGATPDAVAAGASGEILARAVARAPALPRSLAVLPGPLDWRAPSATAAYELLDLPVCFLHGTRNSDATRVARALDAFWRSLAPRPRLHLVPGGRVGPRALGRRTHRDPAGYPRAIKRGPP
jgi:pimeloyl-ACP methyl ester carboxylesterase